MHVSATHTPGICHVPPSPQCHAAKCPEAVTSEPQKRLHYFQQVFTDEALKKEFRSFLENVFYSLDTKKFEALMQDILRKNGSYEEMYTELLTRIGEAKKGTFGTILSQFKALRVLKKVLVSQIQSLLCQGAKVDGYCEIGYPGRLIRPLQKALSLEGKKIVVGYGEKMTDYVEAGFPRPYHTFVPLNDYESLTKAIKPASVDVVVMPIGLHHIPNERLKSFVSSVRDILRPGGSFIIRDHDVVDARRSALAHVAHSVFNAATGEKLKTELQEERHFKDLTSWRKVLEDEGFEVDPSLRMQEGDSTHNILFRCTKKGKDCDALERTLRLTQPGYERAPSQTYLTTLEWHLVHSAKEYGDFVEKKPMERFFYFSHIGVLWKAFFDSCRDALKVAKVAKVASSEYMLMNLFMLCSTSVELAAKGLFSMPLRLCKTHSNQVTRAYADSAKEYAEFIKTIPFYEFGYFQKIRTMLSAFYQSKEKSLSTLYLTALAVGEFAFKGILSIPLNAMYKGTESGTITVIVSDPQSRCSDALDRRIEVLKRVDQYAAIQIPRYLQCVDILEKLSDAGLQIERIAGQKRVQVKVLVSKSQRVDAISGCKALSSIAIPSEPSQHFVRLDVAVEKLSSVIQELHARGATISYIHDF